MGCSQPVFSSLLGATIRTETGHVCPPSAKPALAMASTATHFSSPTWPLSLTSLLFCLQSLLSIGANDRTFYKASQKKRKAFFTKKDPEGQLRSLPNSSFPWGSSSHLRKKNPKSSVRPINPTWSYPFLPHPNSSNSSKLHRLPLDPQAYWWLRVFALTVPSVWNTTPINNCQAVPCLTQILTLNPFSERPSLTLPSRLAYTPPIKLHFSIIIMWNYTFTCSLFIVHLP